jgi:hypothetical protein
MQLLLQQAGVHYVGLVNATVLAEYYARSGFLLYPTSFPETGCVAAMKVSGLAPRACPHTHDHASDSCQ